MKDQSDDQSHHERTLLPQSYISLPLSFIMTEVVLIVVLVVVVVVVVVVTTTITIIIKKDISDNYSLTIIIMATTYKTECYTEKGARKQGGMP